ncbi:unnamed protein product, partial [Brassica rapa subsp. trilocularis]
SLHLISNKRRFLRLCFLRPGRRVVTRTGAGVPFIQVSLSCLIAVCLFYSPPICSSSWVRV